MLQFTSDKLINFSHTLSKIHKAALPNAVRFTLTDAAKDVKFKTLQKHSEQQFDVSKPSFFKKFSGYKAASGYNINNMRATAGMIKAQDTKSVASTKIAAQQTAGIVKDRSYIAAEKQRSKSGVLKRSFITMIQLEPLVYEKGKGGNYIKTAIESKEKRKPLLVRKNGKGYLVKVKSINKKNPVIKTEILASYEKGRDIKLTRKKPFVINAAKESGNKLNKFFIKNAERQISRYK